MDSEMPANDARLSVLESELAESKMREEQTQTTLLAILQRIEQLSLPPTSNTQSTPPTQPPIIPTS